MHPTPALGWAGHAPAGLSSGWADAVERIQHKADAGQSRHQGAPEDPLVPPAHVGFYRAPRGSADTANTEEKKGL